MGNSSSASAAPSSTTSIAKPAIPEGCPMHQTAVDNNANNVKSVPQSNSASECPMWQTTLSPPSQCPVKQSGNVESKAFNVDNMMPPPNQMPAPDQPFSLSTERQVSSIPKGNTDERWVYPSEQMFWNAMLRKGWRWQEEDVTREAMTEIIKIHNINNEEGWRQILLWEAMRYKADGKCPCPKLLRFKGDAQKLSPRARIRTWMGYEKPFDRHDWVIDRCGKEVRYIIDYYDGPFDPQTGRFALLDVRPALDSWTALWDRTKASYMRWMYTDPIRAAGPSDSSSS